MPVVHPAHVMLWLPERGRRARLVAVAYGIVVFLWTGPEDNAVWPVVLLGAGLSALVATLWVTGRFGGRFASARAVIPGALALGATIGLGASIATAALMFFKDARHAHLYPDYPAEQMGAVIQRAPVWALAGALFGLALSLAWLAVSYHGDGDE